MVVWMVDMSERERGKEFNLNKRKVLAQFPQSICATRRVLDILAIATYETLSDFPGFDSGGVSLHRDDRQSSGL